uniref:Uncharacterized protein n=1 Tax=Caenorhabditis japonica TaxID=281687 RepID=A0A8R1IMN7_CAEJA
MTTLEKKQGSVVGVSHDMMIVRYNSKGVLFKKNLLIKRTYKVDDIVQFNARKAATVDIEVSDKLARISGYNIEWVGTEIKYIKTGRTLAGEGVVLNIPEN